MSGGNSAHKGANLKIQDSFLEALRELSLGSGKRGDFPPVPSEMLEEELPKISGRLTPGQTEAISGADLEAKRYKRLFFQERSLRQEERKLRVKDDQEVKLKIQAIRQDLQKLATAQVKMEEQVQIAVFQADTVVAPGVYHVSFLEQLRQFIATLRKNVESASNWLAMFNQKNKKKGYYWNQVKRKGGGSNFYLSGERYMATQAG